MSYVAPSIDSSGLHIPSYQDILDDLVSQATEIYGQDIYLEEDSTDYQFLSILALKMYDTLQTAQLVYNSRGPSTAIGTALDAIVKLNGIARKAAGYSTCQVTITGIAYTVIEDGIVADTNGNSWAVPNSIIGSGGTLDVTVTCETIGAITALTNTITIISTPISGWITVNNPIFAAIPGQSVETDAELRSRQALSVMLPSNSMLEGTIAGIAAVDGVTRYCVYENPTAAVDTDGLPPHSITCVVEGGTDDAVAQAIYDNKSIGCFTNGGQNDSPLIDESITVTIPAIPGTEDMDISFYRPIYVPIYVAISIHPLSGYTSAIGDAVQENIVDYLNSLGIGEDVTIYTGICGAVLASISNLVQPTFSIKAVTAGISSPLASSDIVIDFNEVSQCQLVDVIVTEV